MIRRPPRSTPLYSSAASDVYKRQLWEGGGTESSYSDPGTTGQDPPLKLANQKGGLEPTARVSITIPEGSGSCLRMVASPVGLGSSTQSTSSTAAPSQGRSRRVREPRASRYAQYWADARALDHDTRHSIHPSPTRADVKFFDNALPFLTGYLLLCRRKFCPPPPGFLVERVVTPGTLYNLSLIHIPEPTRPY